MPAEVFVDTAGWASFLWQTEPHHALAKTFVRNHLQSNRRMVTTNYVLVELVTLLASRFRLNSKRVIELTKPLRNAPWLQVVHVDEELDAKAWDHLEERDDKHWSLTDCASFVVMNERGIYFALTTDHHFEQAGYVRLLK